MLSIRGVKDVSLPAVLKNKSLGVIAYQLREQYGIFGWKKSAHHGLVK